MVFRLQLGLFPLLMCLAGLLLKDICRGEHLVDIQEGPLFRVKGYPISISCEVSGYLGLSDQCFEFSFYKPDNPNMELKMLSTCESAFGYAMFSQRVRDGDIRIERRTITSVVLHFALLQAEDAGSYECITPNQFSTYEGTYNAKITVNVIDDTLMVSYSGPSSHSLSEGEALQLECEVSSKTLQHTHLSVTWYVQGSTETSQIIALDRDLTIRPGEVFENQYRSGLISIEKLEDTTYRLKMSQVQKSVSGQIYCQAEEWIQDPDRSWTRIAHKNSTGTSVEIKTLAIAEADSFSTDISFASGSLLEGDKVEIHCSVQTEKHPGHFFSITWQKDNMDVAHIGPSGVLKVATDYTARESEGELKAVKITDKVYVLTIRPVRLVDQGRYKCRATQEERTEKGDFNKGQSKDSPEKTLHITAKESSLAVNMVNRKVEVTEGNTLKLTCNVSGASGPLSVSWQHKRSTGSPLRVVISLSREGVMVDKGIQYQQRTVRTFRSTAADFTLEISNAVMSDSGEYVCTVTEWNMDSTGIMKEVKSLAEQGTVSLNSIDSLLNVVLRSRDTNVFENSLISLYCTVNKLNVPFDVYWKFQPTDSAPQKDIMCMLNDGAMPCGKQQQDYQMEVKVQRSGTDFILKVLRASKRHTGVYECQVTAYQESVQKAQRLSNKLAVIVKSPDSRLSVSMRPKSLLELQVKSNAKADCMIDVASSNSSRFAVTWMLSNQNLVRMDPEGVTTLGSNQEMEQRIYMRMIERRVFQLAIQQVRSPDSGTYNCLVEEWIQDPDGIWYPLKTASANFSLVVNEKATTFNLDKSDHQLMVTEGEQVDLSCSLDHDALDSTLQYSLTWLFESQDQKQPTIQLLTYSHDGRLQLSGLDPELKQRLQFSRPTTSAFHLSILNSISTDSGRYHCQIDQFHLDCKGKWEWKANAKSGFTNVSVHLIESKLQVQKASRRMNVTDRHAGFTVECEIRSRSTDKSHFEVTWSRSQGNGPPMTIFTVRPDGTLYNTIGERHLIYSHPRTTQYGLTVPDVDTFDNGQYQCKVIELLQMASNKWRTIAEDRSGQLTVYVESEKNESMHTLVLENPHTHLSLVEGQDFELSCSVNVDNVDPTIQYSLIWLVEKPNSDTRTVLLKNTYDGQLQYFLMDQQFKNRLQFSKSSATTFHLTVFNSCPTDSGSYQCMVEQFQVDNVGNWEKKGTAESNSTVVVVRNIESKLRVKKVNQGHNVTNHRAGFTVECEIESRSSDNSVFEVTWTRIEENGRPLVIFSVNQDGINNSPERPLVYLHPSATLYKLTVPDVKPADNGQYQCVVVEWLHTATNSWRMVAKDKSGEHSVHVHVEGTAELKQDKCFSGIIMGGLIPLIVCLLGVIVLLLITVRKAKAASKKQNDSLWAEKNPLKPFSNSTADANEGDKD